MSKDKPSKKATVPPARKGPKLSAAQQEQFRAKAVEATKKIRGGQQALQDSQDDQRLAFDRVAETMAGIELVPRGDTKILKELRKMNATLQRQLPSPPSQNKPLSIAVVLRYFKVSRSTIYRAVADGRLTDCRPEKNKGTASPLLLDPVEVARYFPRIDSPPKSQT